MWYELVQLLKYHLVLLALPLSMGQRLRTSGSGTERLAGRFPGQLKHCKPTCLRFWNIDRYATPSGEQMGLSKTTERNWDTFNKWDQEMSLTKEAHQWLLYTWNQYPFNACSNRLSLATCEWNSEIHHFQKHHCSYKTWEHYRFVGRVISTYGSCNHVPQIYPSYQYRNSHTKHQALNLDSAQLARASAKCQELLIHQRSQINYYYWSPHHCPPDFLRENKQLSAANQWEDLPGYYYYYFNAFYKLGKSFVESVPWKLSEWAEEYM